MVMKTLGIEIEKGPKDYIFIRKSKQHVISKKSTEPTRKA